MDMQKNLIDRVAMGDMFRRKASTLPHLDAVVEFREGTRRCLSHRQFNESLNRVAHMLRSLGIQPGDRVALAGPNSIEFEQVIYRCMKGGFVVIPLNHLQGREDLVYTINHCSAKVVIVEDSLADKFDGIKSDLDSAEHWINMVVTGCSVSSHYLDFQTAINNASAEEVIDVVIKGRDPLQILYTSGTTSKPKGVETSHLALFMNTLAAIIELGVEPKMTGSSRYGLYVGVRN
ncbi:MAG: hypothetical protein COB89_05860 [Piscirickettsiaceae bacterium]|nr:MAG: hypothetical protein COB89_05860 [Piscirickettsiaceae bacterium]